MDPEDAALIEAFLAGDEAAVATVGDWLDGATARFRTRLASYREDLVQELLAEVTQVLRRGAFRGQSRLRTYLSGIATYSCLNRLRDARRRPVTTALPVLASDEPSPLQSVLAHETGERLRRILARTSEGCRELWRMILAGWSYRRMSEELSVAEGTLRVRVLRCRKAALALWRGESG